MEGEGVGLEDQAAVPGADDVFVGVKVPDALDGRFVNARGDRGHGIFEWIPLAESAGDKDFCRFRRTNPEDNPVLLGVTAEKAGKRLVLADVPREKTLVHRHGSFSGDPGCPQGVTRKNTPCPFREANSSGKAQNVNSL